MRVPAFSECVAAPDELASFELQLREEHARRYDADYLAIHGPWFPEVELAILRRALCLSSEDVLVDMGCGTGRLTVRLAPFCTHVIAMDRSPGSLAFQRQQMRDRGVGNISTVEADVTERPRMDSPVTKVVSVQPLQHIPTCARRRAALRNAFDALRPGGRIVLVDENHGAVHRLRAKPRESAHPNVLVFHSFEPDEIRADLESSGYRVDRVGGCGVPYWTRYRISPRSFAILDNWLAFVPGASLIAKFLVSVGIKPVSSASS